jgi:hypothetical protein
MGYGLADSRITGGGSVPARPGPPHLPAHGADWRPVARRSHDPAAGLPLPALLSQAVVAFAIDYEAGDTRSLAAVSVLAGIDDGGVPAARFRPDGFWRGHGSLTAEVPAPEGRGKVVHLTAAGRALAADHGPRSAAVERAWRDRHGDELVTTVRTAAEALTRAVGPPDPRHGIASWIAGAFSEP